MDTQENRNNEVRLEVYDPMRMEYILKWDMDNEDLSRINRRVFKSKPTVEESRKIVEDYYNEECEKELKTGLVYDGHPVYLSEHNQLNYNTIYTLRSRLTTNFTPIKIKLGTENEPVYYTFNTAEEFKAFYKECGDHIINTLDKYWSIKESLNWDTFDKTI